MDGIIRFDHKNTEEYETQYFTFGRQSLKESLKSLVESKLQTLVQEAEEYFTSTSNVSEQYKKKISAKCANLLDFSLKKSKIQLGKVEALLDEHFSIPTDLTLPEDEIYQEVSEEDIEKIRLETEELEMKILFLTSAESALEKELAKADALQYTLDEERVISAVFESLQAESQLPDTVQYDVQVEFDVDK